MKTGSVESADLARSVISVPPRAGIARMGAMLPHLSNLPASAHARLKSAASALLAHDKALP